MRTFIRTTTRVVKLNTRPPKRKLLALKFVPYVVDTAVLHNHIDMKTMITSAEDMMLCESAYIATQVAIVLYNIHTKNMSENS